MTLPLSKLVAIGAAHAELEATQDLEGLLATMEGEPVYEFHPLGRCFRGMARTRRYYEHFMANVQPTMRGYRQRSEGIGSEGLVQEYAVTVAHPGEAETTTHSVMAILTFGKEGLSGERIYSDEKFLRLLAGPLWAELEPIA